MPTAFLNFKNSSSELGDVSKYDETFVAKSIRQRMEEEHCNSIGEYFDLVEKCKQEEINLLDSLQISYSLFFRNSFTFSVLETHILPTLIQRNKEQNRKELRIWSAACAAGQEAYSLAILLEEYNATHSEKINYRIFATDQSEIQLQKARKGQYDFSALGHVSLKSAKTFFTKKENIYSVRKVLKNNIDFSAFNLFDEQLSSPPSSVFGDFDLVVCANLLFYYKPPFRKIILKKIKQNLSAGGYLVTGETEREILLQHGFLEVFPQSAIFRNK